MPDHIHVLAGVKPAMCISDLIRDIKNNSINFINDRGWLKQEFCRQDGYGSFSYSHSAFGHVIEYIKNQKIHHEKRTFREGYHELLQKFEIPFEEQYIFEFYDSFTNVIPSGFWFTSYFQIL
jgi:putative transposase